MKNLIELRLMSPANGRSFIIKLQLIVFCLFVFSANTFGQNLIPNPGFEKYTQLPCDCMQGDLSNYVEDWQNAGIGTADYIHSKTNESCYANPRSLHWDSYGYELPHGGDGMGMIMTEGKNGSYREYLGLVLNKPIKKGKEYYVEFYISLGDYSGLATNNLGLLFSIDKPKHGADGIIHSTPQINFEEVLTQVEGWVKVSGTFIADNNFKYMTIGNFSTNGSTSSQVMPKLSYSGEHTYREGAAAYYVDDFLVEEMNPDKLTITGDTLVIEGGLSTLTANGANKYKWADEKQPSIIIAYGPELNRYIQNTTTFLLYTDIDTVAIKVNVQNMAVAQLEGRNVAEKCVLSIYSDEIQIEVYDKSYVDGDILSLYNGSILIASHVVLEKNKKVFTVHIDRSKSTQIIVFAENVGQFSPNTACVIIKDGEHETEIMLESDFFTSDSVVLNYAGAQ